MVAHLQRQRPDLGAVAMRDDDLRPWSDHSDPLDRIRMSPLVWADQVVHAGRMRTAEGDDDPHRCSPSAATRTALIVCIRFSASSKTRSSGGCSLREPELRWRDAGLRGDSRRPSFSKLWKHGRQCMNFTPRIACGGRGSVTWKGRS